MGNNVDQDDMERRTIAVMLFDEYKQKATKSVFVHPDFGSLTNFGIRNKIDKGIFYHNSYDILMPVWVKFRDMNLMDITDAQRLYYNVHYQNITTALTQDTITEFFIYLSSAIIWYQNLQSQQN